mmetsp:Transcript_32934/g.99670  ORF Transcript_32934/g.99670 Transcript_32934/m.99670 type:complete len:107 (-) Transcript_32934:3345-3665(-)
MRASRLGLVGDGPGGGSARALHDSWRTEFNKLSTWHGTVASVAVTLQCQQLFAAQFGATHLFFSQAGNRRSGSVAATPRPWGSGRQIDVHAWPRTDIASPTLFVAV